MHIVCISRGTFAGGKELAESLARKLGVPCVGREELTDAATHARIPVGKIEMAIMRPRPLTEQLAVERDRFKAFVSATLAERALSTGLVYHGRTGHLALPNVPGVLRVRVVMDPENRIAQTMRRLGLSRRQAQRYNEQVDDDRNRWSRALYKVDCSDPDQYDVVTSLERVSAENAATALVAMAQLPEFQSTPASQRALENVLLAGRCRVAVGEDPRTRPVDVQIRAVSGRVYATYPPRHEDLAPAISEVLKRVDGVEFVQCTMASTNILWIEERYEPTSHALPQLLEIAAKWNAAVSLVRLLPDDSEAPPEPTGGDDSSGDWGEDAGILDDEREERPSLEDAGVAEVTSALLQDGRAGERRTVRGGAKELIQSLDRTATYSLVVVGDVFLNKDASVRKRMTRELGASVADSLRIPVINTSELEAQYLFGTQHFVRLLGLGLLTAAAVALVLHEQIPVLRFLTARGIGHQLLATALLVAFIPTYAAVYGTFSQYLLRLLKFE
jgi:cytidylate kinase